MPDEWGIYWIDLGVPYGHEQGGPRPAIITRNVHGICIVIPLTTNADDLSRFSHTLQISSTVATRLSTNSVALIFQIRAIDQTRVKSKIGELESHQIFSIKAEMKSMFAIA
jgi:mRNA interferase MazF